MTQHTLSATCVAHVYYPGSWQLICEKSKNVFRLSDNVLISSCYDKVIDEIDIEHAILFRVSNIGKDIGGKLHCLKFYLEHCNKTDLLLFFHDKISPQSLNSTYWFDNLFSIFQPEKYAEIVSLFAKNSKIGMVGAKQFLKNEYVKSSSSFSTTNNELILYSMKKYKINCRRYDFIAGSIFIVRSKIYEDFFGKVDPLHIRALLEPGNVLDLSIGTYTHTWERLLSLIVESQGYKVQGV